MRRSTKQLPQKLKIKRITLGIEEDNFQRRVNIHRERQLSNPFYSGEIYSLQFQKTNINNKDIQFGSSAVTDKAIILKISNRDDQPLTIGDIQVEYLSNE